MHNSRHIPGNTENLEKGKSLLADALMGLKGSQGTDSIRQAIKYLSVHLKQVPGDVKALVLRSSAYRAVKNYEDAGKDLQAARENSVSDPAILDEISVGFMQAGCFAEAMDCLEKALTLIDPGDEPEQYFSIRFNRALVHYYRDDLMAAIDELSRLREEQPENPRIYSLLGTLNEFLEDRETAEQMYRKSILLTREKDAQAKEYWLLGELYRRNNFFDQAITVYQLGLKTFPDEVANMFGIWETTFEKGEQIARLSDCITVARRLASKSLRNRFTLAILYLAADEKENARNEFQAFRETAQMNPREWGMRLAPEIKRAARYVTVLDQMLT